MPRPTRFSRADLLYKIHLLVQLPLWQYILIDYPQVGVITVTRTSKRID